MSDGQVVYLEHLRKLAIAREFLVGAIRAALYQCLDLIGNLLDRSAPEVTD